MPGSIIYPLGARPRLPGTVADCPASPCCVGGWEDDLMAKEKAEFDKLGDTIPNLLSFAKKIMPRKLPSIPSGYVEILEPGLLVSKRDFKKYAYGEDFSPGRVVKFRASPSVLANVTRKLDLSWRQWPGVPAYWQGTAAAYFWDSLAKNYPRSLAALLADKILTNNGFSVTIPGGTVGGPLDFLGDFGSGLWAGVTGQGVGFDSLLGGLGQIGGKIGGMFLTKEIGGLINGNNPATNYGGGGSGSGSNVIVVPGAANAASADNTTKYLLIGGAVLLGVVLVTRSRK